MNYNESALNEFLSVLQRKNIYSLLSLDKKFYTSLDDSNTIDIILALPNEKKYITQLFPPQTSLLFGVIKGATKYDEIYKKINDAIPGLGISYIYVNDRKEFSISITISAKLAKQASKEYEKWVETRDSTRQLLNFAGIRKQLDDEEDDEDDKETVNKKRGGTRRILRNAKSRKHRGHRTSKQLLHSKKSIKIRKPRKLRKYKKTKKTNYD